MIAEISTGTPSGSSLVPSACRVCRPRSPNTLKIRSEAPLRTFGCSSKAGADLCRSGAVLQADVATDHAVELDLAVPAGDHAWGVQQLADLLDRHIGGERLRWFGQLESERTQGRLSRIHAQDPPRPCGEQPRSTSSARLGRAVEKRVPLPVLNHHLEPVKGWLTRLAWL